MTQRDCRFPFCSLAISTCVLAAAGSAQVEFLSIQPLNPPAPVGHAVAPAGDLDGDDRADLLVTMPTAASRDGAIRVYSTGTGQLLLEAYGPRGAGAVFGWSAAGLGEDLDRDGVPELLVGAPEYRNAAAEPGVGALLVVSGRTGRTLRIHVGDGGGDLLGSSVAAVGDVDGDGVGDYAAGAPENGYPIPYYDNGYVRVWSGRTGLPLHFWKSDKFPSEFGQVVLPIGDVDGDGRPDIVATAYLGAFHDGSIGFARLYSGGTGKLLHTLRGRNGDEHFGMSAAAVGDVDGDRVPDVAIGVVNPFNFGRTGRVYVYSGRTGTIVRELVGTAGSLMFGRSMCAVGDVDGDGFTDVWVGDPGDTHQGARRGSGRVFSLRSSTQIGIVLSPQPGVGFGVTAASLGDLDGDGKDEFAVSLPRLAAGGFVSVRTLASTTRVGNACGPGRFRLDASVVRLSAGGFDCFLSGRRRNAIGALWIGVRPPLPTVVGECTLWLDPALVAMATAFRTDAAGRVHHRQFLPADRSLIDLEIAAQSLLVNPHTAAGIESSNAVYARVLR